MQIIDDISGIPFTIRIVKKGDNYGINDALMHDKKMPLIEFYDARFMHTEYGQFIARYYADSLADRKPAGLDLMGYEPEWKICEKSMHQITLLILKTILQD